MAVLPPCTDKPAKLVFLLPNLFILSKKNCLPPDLNDPNFVKNEGYENLAFCLDCCFNAPVLTNWAEPRALPAFGFETEPGATLQTIQAGGLPAGLYFLQIISEGRIIATERFVRH